MTKNEFEKLQPGQLIQHKKNNEWAFLVHQNFGDRLTAVRTIEIRDPSEWETVTEVKMTEPEKIPETPQPHDIRKAAHDLHEQLVNNHWFATIGIADNKLIVYTSRKKYPKGNTQFQGFPVEYHYFGKVAPATVS